MWVDGLVAWLAFWAGQARKDTDYVVCVHAGRFGALPGRWIGTGERRTDIG